MERAKSLPSKFGVQRDQMDSKNVEFFADNLSFKCVWEEKKLDDNILMENESMNQGNSENGDDVILRMVNNFMDEVDIDDDIEYSPSVSALLAAISADAFSSGGFEEVMSVEEEEYAFAILTSTPLQKNYEANSSSAERRHQIEAAREFNEASPIPFTSRNRQVFMKRRCRLSFSSEENSLQKILKKMKL